MAGSIFISYCRADQAYVDRLKEYLQRNRLPVWMDRELSGSDRWLTVLREQIDACAALVLVMTPEAEQSEMVESELLRARDKGKQVFALLLRGSPFWHLSNRQYESVVDGLMPGEPWLQRVAAAVGGAVDLATAPPDAGEPGQAQPDESITRPAAGPGRQDPLAAALLKRLDEIRDSWQQRMLVDSPVHSFPDVPLRKELIARKLMQIPEGEPILLMVDQSLLHDGKHATVLTGKALYFKLVGAELQRIDYRAFPRQTFAATPTLMRTLTITTDGDLTVCIDTERNATQLLALLHLIQERTRAA